MLENIVLTLIFIGENVVGYPVEEGRLGVALGRGCGTHGVAGHLAPQAGVAAVGAHLVPRPGGQGEALGRVLGEGLQPLLVQPRDEHLRQAVLLHDRGGHGGGGGQRGQHLRALGARLLLGVDVEERRGRARPDAAARRGRHGARELDLVPDVQLLHDRLGAGERVRARRGRGGAARVAALEHEARAEGAGRGRGADAALLGGLALAGDRLGQGGEVRVLGGRVGRRLAVAGVVDARQPDHQLALPRAPGRLALGAARPRSVLELQVTTFATSTRALEIVRVTGDRLDGADFRPRPTREGLGRQGDLAEGALPLTNVHR